ncbi:hypothetical protein N9060_00870, partial [Arenicella sp.]|nr:hypothetical protein [Arenicella sp.]
MPAYSNIDRETFQWVRAEVEVTLDAARNVLQQHANADNKEGLHELISYLHQVVGSLQMLELKSLSTLIMESEFLVEDYSSSDSSISKSSFVEHLENGFSTLSTNFVRIEQGLSEQPIEIVELINEIRALRGLEDIEIGALFSPMIEVFPEVNSKRALTDTDYIQRAVALRKLYQVYMLQWLRDQDKSAINKIHLVFDKLSQMSTFSTVSRLWWVATSYTEFIEHNELQNKSVHGRIMRELDDQLRSLEQQGESALVRDPAEELIKIMLFYIATASHHTPK